MYGSRDARKILDGMHKRVHLVEKKINERKRKIVSSSSFIVKGGQLAAVIATTRVYVHVQ